MKSEESPGSVVDGEGGGGCARRRSSVCRARQAPPAPGEVTLQRQRPSNTQYNPCYRCCVDQFLFDLYGRGCIHSPFGTVQATPWCPRRVCGSRPDSHPRAAAASSLSDGGTAPLWRTSMPGMQGYERPWMAEPLDMSYRTQRSSLGW